MSLKRFQPLLPVLLGCAIFAAYSSIHLFDGPIGTHGWRQAIATSIARVYADGQPFLYPRAEGCGAEPNVFMGSEFPLYPYVMGKLGGRAGINFVGRVMGILSAFVWMLSLAAIVRFLFQRWREPYLTLVSAAAGCYLAVAPLYRFYGISFVPDIYGHALCLLGIALYAGPLVPGRDAPGPQPLTTRRFLIATLLLAVGALTKLIALPHLSLAGLVLLDRLRGDGKLTAIIKPRPIAFGLGMALVVLGACWLWYRHWVPVLKTGGCELVWLPETPDDTWKTMTFTDAEWRFRMSKWGREDLLGPLWPLAVAGVLLAPVAGWRGLYVWIWFVGCAGTFVRLGWHTKQHDYDLLVVLPAFAVGVATSVGLIARGLGFAAKKLGIVVPERATPVILTVGLAAGMLALSPGAHSQSRRHIYEYPGEIEMQAALDKVLPDREPIHYWGGKNDPRIPYFTARRAWGTEPWLYCQQKEVKYDCCLITDTKGNLAPCIERRAAVAWANRALVCGIMTPDKPFAPERVLQTLKGNITSPADEALPGVGRFLGADFVLPPRDVKTNVRTPVIDLYVLPERDGVPLEVFSGERKLALDPPPERWLAGTVIVARATLPAEGAPVTLKWPGGSRDLARAR